MKRRCVGCGRVKRALLFNRDATRPSGRCPYCKACRSKRDHGHYVRNRRSRQAKGRTYYAQNREMVLASVRRYIRKNRERVRERAFYANIRRAYGISRERYDAMLERQAGRCAICHLHETEKGRGGRLVKLSVDHDHRTGVVRGLLCRKCNLLLAKAQDDPNRLYAAASYLKRAKRGVA